MPILEGDDAEIHTSATTLPHTSLDTKAALLDTTLNTTAGASPDASLDSTTTPITTSNTSTTQTRNWTKESVIRQVEHYFSDENLATDAHLLWKLKEAKYGPGLVSLKQIFGWSRMRDCKSYSEVKEALRESKVLEVVQNKYIRRKIPFDMAKAKVANKVLNAQELEAAKKTAVLKANPHLTSGLLKPTGFEHDHKEPARSPEERQADDEDYSTDNTFYYRMELAILRFRKKRKVHQETAKLFDYYLMFCGFAKNSGQFRGGLKAEDMEELSKEEKETITMEHFALDEAKISLDNEDGEWIVNFPSTLRGFFSTRFPSYFDITHQAIVEASCNVLRNWFKYLLHHNVFAEYTDQLQECLTLLPGIEKELPLIAKASKSLPGAFNIAASITMNGTDAASYVKKEFYEDDDFMPEFAADAIMFTKKEAQTIFLTGVVAYGTQAQVDDVEAHVEDLTKLKVFWEDSDVNLEIIEITPLSAADPTTQELFQKLGHTIVPSLGKITCQRHDKPDLSERVLPPGHWIGHATFDFIVDEKALKNCYVGLKFDAEVKQLENGIMWIDHLHFCEGSFYKWCWNEIVSEGKAAAKKDPKGWGRSIEFEDAEDEGGVAVDGDESWEKAAAEHEGDGGSDFSDDDD